MSLPFNDPLTRSTTYTNAMNVSRAPDWLPSFLTPFVTLSYPVERPVEPDSFPDSSYYGNGVLDICLIITCIAVMAILRDFLRLGVCEPFAKWYLARRLRLTKVLLQNAQNANGDASKRTTAKTNGVTNGNGHAVQGNVRFVSKKEARQIRHNVIRFAEQGWPALYYILQFCFGVVSLV